MAKKKDNLKDASKAELQKQLTSFEESLRVLRFNTQGSKSKNVKEQATLRKNIARVLTLLNTNNK